MATSALINNAHIGAFRKVNSHINAVLENVKTNIGNLSTGVWSISSGGPQFGVSLQKLNANYWSALVFTYEASVFNGLAIGQYMNGTCSVTIIN